jgi:hypothetical protein
VISGGLFLSGGEGGVGGGASDLEDAGGFGDGLAAGYEPSEGGELGGAGGRGAADVLLAGQHPALGAEGVPHFTPATSLPRMSKPSTRTTRLTT